MNSVRKKKLILILSLLAGFCVVFFLMFFALRQNLDHFYSPIEVNQGEAQIGQRLKVGGLVKTGSVIHSQDELSVTFLVTDTLGDIKVKYSGILPDLFREGQGIVAKGVLIAANEVDADEVLAKHDENYTPPEAAAALLQASKIKAASQPTDDQQSSEGYQSEGQRY